MDFKSILSQSSKKPTSILKMVLAFSVALLVIWMFLASRMEITTNEASSSPEVQLRTEGLKASLMKAEPADSTEAAVATNTEEVAVQAGEEKSVFKSAFTTFAVLLSLLGLVWLWAKRKSNPSAKTVNGRDLGEHVLGQGAQLKFVEINNEVWVIGVSTGSLNLMHRIPRDEWNENEGMKESMEMTKTPSDFKSLYKMFKN